ncbi:MAG: DegV family protein [Clostridium sp.]|nr:MAG: DegV family protein [Clostridium sp.]
MEVFLSWERKLLQQRQPAVLIIMKIIMILETIRIKLDIDGKLYADGSEMPANDFFKLLKENPTLIPKTTQVPIGELLDFFEGLYNEGYDEVFL